MTLIDEIQPWLFPVGAVVARWERFHLNPFPNVKELEGFRMEWQFKSTAGCQTHQLRLLSKCPRCGARFKRTALWEDGCCDSVALRFAAVWGDECLSESYLSEVFFWING